MRWHVLLALLFVGTLTVAHAEDFSQWRGPRRNGVTVGSPKLDIRWGKNGPAMLWESESVPGDLHEGSGCVSVAGGKAYVYVHSKPNEPIGTRVLRDRGLRRLGWSNVKVPERIMKAVEEARTSAELEKLTSRARRDWINKWAKQHVPASPQKRVIDRFVMDRLNRGKGALPGAP